MSRAMALPMHGWQYRAAPLSDLPHPRHARAGALLVPAAVTVVRIVAPVHLFITFIVCARCGQTVKGQNSVKAIR